MFTPTRRVILASSIAAALLPRFAMADTARDFTIDWQGGEQTPELLAALEEQIALVKSVRVKPEVAAFFAAQVITVDLAPNTKTRAGPRGVFFQRSPVPPPANPVLLHEMLHRYHFLKLADGYRNATVLAFYRKAKAAGDWRPRAYLYTDVKEFFAMVTSVALYGHAARPPFTRALVETKLPDMYRWIVGEFGLET